MTQKIRFKSAAVLTIRGAPRMTAFGRRMVAKWLRKQADALIADGKNYAPRVFTARYLHRES